MMGSRRLSRRAISRRTFLRRAGGGMAVAFAWAHCPQALAQSDGKTPQPARQSAPGCLDRHHSLR